MVYLHKDLHDVGVGGREILYHLLYSAQLYLLNSQSPLLFLLHTIPQLRHDSYGAKPTHCAVYCDLRNSLKANPKSILKFTHVLASNKIYFQSLHASVNYTVG